VENWDTLMGVNLSSAYYCAKEAGAIFRKQGSGSLIFTASISGHIANVPQNQACYNASKAAMIHLAKSLALEWAGFARVNSVSPGYIKTPISAGCSKEMKDEWFSLTPMRREADAKELKGIYLYLASDASNFTTGADIIVDGVYCVR
jgi:sorbose reductase